MDAQLFPVTVKLPAPIIKRVKDSAKKQGKKLQAHYAELLLAGLAK